jgi:acetyl esterase/lipase
MGGPTGSSSTPLIGIIRGRLSVAIIALFVALLLGACSRHHDIDRNKAAMPLDDLTVVRDIPYASGGIRHSLDVYVQRTPSAPRPVVVFIYGGTWISGSKSEFAWVGAALARLGYVAIVPDYRIFPDGVWPRFLEDNAAALRWAQDHAQRFGGSPANLFLIGHSAGAFNVVSLATDHRWLSAKGMDPQRDLRGVIGLAGPYEMVPDTDQLRTVLGPPSQWAEIHPITHVNGRSPPLLLIVGDKDLQVGTAEGERLAAKVQRYGAPVEVRHYPETHNGMLDALALRSKRRSNLARDCVWFISSHLAH